MAVGAVLQSGCGMKIEIDQGSGFCFGVTRAIGKAEEELAAEGQLYCLGDIVHNGKECNRLQQMGLVTINHEQMRDIHDAKVLLRAHGEPPSTYALARENAINLIDATCPVVLHLQERIKKEYDEKIRDLENKKIYIVTYIITILGVFQSWMQCSFLV